MLFVELALIRGTTAAVIYLSFFTNLVLLASFLGIGLGFLRAKGDRDPLRHALWLLAGLLAFVLVFPVRVGAAIDRVPQLFGVGQMHALPQWVSLPIIFLGVAAVMTVIAERVGRLFSAFAPLEAYRLDVLGSIAGIAVFSALSFADAGPFVWILVAVALLLFLLRSELTWIVGGSVALLLLFGVLTLLQPRDIWSPYQHVTWATHDDGTISIRVNNRPHQTMAPLSLLLSAQPFYSYPYTHLPSTPGDVLIVGAGSGNDVALALARGATHVDAVEIDPVLQRLGRDLHPEHPYQDPRVSVHIDDGRAFLEQSHATLRPDRVRAAGLADARVRPGRRCAWRATCSRPRRCRRSGSISSRAARSPCTTTTAATCSTATPPRSPRSSAMRRASIEVGSGRRRAPSRS